MATIDDFNSATLATHSWRQYMIHGNSQAIATWAAAQTPQVDPSTLETKDVPNWLGFSDGENLQVMMRVGVTYRPVQLLKRDSLRWD